MPVLLWPDAKDIHVGPEIATRLDLDMDQTYDLCLYGIDEGKPEGTYALGVLIHGNVAPGKYGETVVLVPSCISSATECVRNHTFYILPLRDFYKNGMTNTETKWKINSESYSVDSSVMLIGYKMQDPKPCSLFVLEEEMVPTTDREDEDNNANGGASGSGSHNKEKVKRNNQILPRVVTHIGTLNKSASEKAARAWMQLVAGGRYEYDETTKKVKITTDDQAKGQKNLVAAVETVQYIFKRNFREDMMTDDIIQQLADQDCSFGVNDYENANGGPNPKRSKASAAPSAESVERCDSNI